MDLLAVQGTPKSLLQHHSSKASILWHSAFFMVELSHPYMTTGKTIALTRWTFVGKVMSLFFNILSRLVIAFLPISKHLLISWLQSPSAVISEPKKIKSDAVSIVSFDAIFCLFVCLWLCWVLAFATCGESGYSLVAVRRLRTAAASRCGARVSIVVASGLSYPAACGICGIFLDQGPNLCLLRW